MADYTTVAEVRAMEDMEDASAISDDLITEAIDYAEELIDRFTGTSWVYKSFSTTITGNDRTSILLRDIEGRVILYPQTLTSVTIDGDAVADTSGWALYPEGILTRDTGVFTDTFPGRNIVVAGTAGITSAAPNDIAWCARTLARQYILDLVSRVPDRATGVQTPDGNITFAQASAHPDRPTSLPEVNARLVRRRQRGPGF